MCSLVRLLLLHVSLCWHLSNGVSISIYGNTLSQNSRSGGLTVKAIYNVHEPSRTHAHGCDERLKRNSIFRVEALRYATKKLTEWYNSTAAKQNKSNNWLKNKINIFDYCGNATHLFQRISDFNWQQPFNGPATFSDASLLEIAYKSRKMPIFTASASRESCDATYIDQNLYTMLPPDIVQLQAIVDILEYFKWTYVSLVTLDKSYALNIEETFKKEIEKRNICIEKSIRISSSGILSEFQNITRTLKLSKAKVVVMLTFAYNPIPLIEVAKSEDLIWLINAGWTEGAYTFKDLMNSNEKRQILTLDYDGMEDRGFMDYFLNLTLNNNNYMWFQQFWSEEFQCNTKPNSTYDKLCNGSESLRLKYNDYNFPHGISSTVIDGVYLYNCMMEQAISACDMKYPYYKNDPAIDWKLYACSFLGSTFLSSIPNNKSQCPSIERFQGFTDGQFIPRNMKLTHITDTNVETLALWKYNQKTKSGSVIRNTKGLPDITSQCSSPCKAWQVKYQDNPKCCFKCLDKHDITSIKFHLGLSSAVSTIGILLTAVVFGIYIKYWNSRIIKASSRELCMIILLALTLCFTSSFVYHLRPTKTSCRLKMFVFGIVFTSCYTPLLLKITRIYRIFKASQVSTSKPYLVSTRSQVLICMALLGLQVLLGWLWVYMDPPKIRKIADEYREYTYCNHELRSFAINAIPCFSLMLACTVLASKTRRFPANFNEASSIGMTMYIICFVWGVFVPAVLFFHQKQGLFVIYIIDYFNNMVALITLVGLFLPKCRRLLFLSSTVSEEVRAAESRWTVADVRTEAVNIHEESTGSPNDRFKATGSTNDKIDRTGGTNDNCEAAWSTNEMEEVQVNININIEATGSTNNKERPQGAEITNTK